FKDGATALATNALSGGVATYTTSALTVSNHTMSAVYSGDANFNASTSVSLIEIVSTARVTAGTGGTNISADKAQNGAAPAFTKLGNIVIAEVINTDIAGGTLILTPPGGWRFGAGTGSVSFVAGRNITSASIAVTTNTITVTLATRGSAALDTLTI